jgi:hypothetical protein
MFKEIIAEKIPSIHTSNFGHIDGERVLSDKKVALAYIKELIAYIGFVQFYYNDDDKFINSCCGLLNSCLYGETETKGKPAHDQ